jgi:hypothetical protein
MSGGVSDYRRNLAWVAGKKAAMSSKPKTVCNRERGTIYYDDWMDGYNSVPRPNVSVKP